MAHYEYPRPALTTDVALFAGAADDPLILLVRRAYPPFTGMWALPGGFVDQGEYVEAAARRELAEETGIEYADPLIQVGGYGDPGRDPRGWTVTILWAAYVGDEPLGVTAGDDAAATTWLRVSELGELAFDHRQLVADALEELRLRGTL